MNRSYEVAIIGAGTAGLAALKEVRKHTDDFVIVNAGDYGTTCARVGCMPSKALVEAANAFHRRKVFESLGIHGADRLTVDIPAVLRRVRQLRDRFIHNLVELTDGLAQRSVVGHARFAAPDVLEVNGERWQVKKTIIATGSRPVLPPGWAALGPRVLTTDELFEQESLPARMAVIGMGAIGTEIAQALARLGIQVTAFAVGRTIAGLTDLRVSEQAVRLLGAECQLLMGERVELEGDGAGAGVRVRSADASFVFDKVLAALGRRPNLDGLGLGHLGVMLDERGLPAFDRGTMQIGDLPIYIAGDVTDEVQVLHEASDEGYISGQNASLQTPMRFPRRTPLAIIFTDPNIATIGARFDALDPDQVRAGEVDFSRQGRALIAIENRGLLRIYAAKDTGRLLGAELCAPGGEHLAHLLALAMERKLTVQQLLRMPFYHPVFEEGLRTALRDLAQQLGPIAASDLANCDPVQ
jgi:dihydrolipoamide dehydrogenase